MATFNIEPDGTLVLESTKRDEPGSNILLGVQGVAATADGFIYTTSVTTRAIAIFRRSGENVDLIDVVETPELGHHGDILISNDGAHIYTAQPSVDQISIFERDSSSGIIRSVQTIGDDPAGRGLASPTRIRLSADGRRFYVASADNDSVALLLRDDDSGELSYVRAVLDQRDQVIGIGGSRDIAIAPTESHIYVAGADDSAIALFDAALTFIAVERNNAGAINGLQLPSAIAVAPDGRHVYSASFSDAVIAIFDRDEDGALSFAGNYAGGGGNSLLTQPSSLAFSSDGTLLLVADFGGDALHAIRRDVQSGELSPLATIDRDNGPQDLRGIASVALSPDNGVAVALSVLTNSALLFNVAEGTNELTFRGTMPAMATPTASTFSADGRHLYTTSGGNNVVLAFERRNEGSTFPQIQVIRDSESGMDLVSPSAIAATRDGRSIYIASGSGIILSGEGSNAIAAISRDSGSGGLSFVESQVDGMNGVSGINGAAGVAVSPDDRLVAVSGFAGNSLAIFERLPGSTALRFVESYFDEDPETAGLAGALDLAFSANGRNLYVTGFADSAITVFSVTPLEPPCAGDCDGVGGPRIGDIIRCVGYALSEETPVECFACDANADGRVSIGDLIQTVRAALDGCPS